MAEPQRGISTVVAEEAAERNSPTFLPVLIDIKHPAITWGDSDEEQTDGHLRLVNDTVGIKYKGNDAERHYYAPCNFSITMPKEDGKKKSNAKISVSCIDQRMVEVIRSIDENLTCSIVAFYGKKTNDNGTVSYIFSKLAGKDFEMSDVSWEGTTAQWTLDPDKIMALNIPRDKGSIFRNPSVMSN